MEGRNTGYEAWKVTQEIASDLPEYSRFPDILTQEEIRRVIERLINYGWNNNSSGSEINQDKI